MNLYEILFGITLHIVLKSQGASDSEVYIRQICRTYPKFTPLLYSHIPENLISVIWNDPVMQQLASIIGNKQVRINFTIVVKGVK